jgi:rare lipoprotein A
VTNVRNGKSTEVVVVDRGPFTGGRLIDVSASAAETLGFKQAGVGLVRIEPIGQ